MVREEPQAGTAEIILRARAISKGAIPSGLSPGRETAGG